MKKTKIKKITTFDGELTEAFSPQSVALTLEDEIDISRGDMICYPDNIPDVSSELEAMVVWMSDTNIDMKKTFIIKHTTNEAKVSVSKIRYKIDVNTLRKESVSQISLNEICRVLIKSHQPLYFDPYRNNRSTGSFILIDPNDYGTVASGMIISRKTADKTDKEIISKKRNINEEPSLIDRADRQKQFQQKAVTIWLTGLSGAGKSYIAKNLERSLFDSGHAAYLLDGDNLRFGLSKDLGFTREERSENIGRVAEVSKLLNDSGMIVITAFISPFASDREIARNIIGDKAFVEVHINTPLNLCEERDTKGLYEKARKGQILDFTGISSPYEAPEKPELVIRGDNSDVVASVKKILNTVNDYIKL